MHFVPSSEKSATAPNAYITYIRRSRLPAHTVKIELGEGEPEMQKPRRPNEDTSSTAEEMQIDGQSFQGKYLSLYTYI